MVCEWDVPLSMLGKSLKVAVCLSEPKTVVFRAGDATRVWTAGGRGLDLSMRWEWEIIPLERISLYTELARFARSLIYRPRVCTRRYLMIDRASEASAEKILMMRV